MFCAILSLWDPILCFPDKLLLGFGQDKEQGTREENMSFEIEELRTEPNAYKVLG